ncbi:MAG: hypothetical protein ABIA37_02855 [Candidatus Woesearchaeota archaeon]
MTKRKHSLEEVLDHVLDNGPRSIRELGVRLWIDEAEELILALSKRGMKLKPYDFPNTGNVWVTSNDSLILYRRLATKQLISAVSRKAGVDYRRVEGFKEILPKLGVAAFKKEPINEWGTTLGGLLTFYHNSNIQPVLELVKNDPGFILIKSRNLQPYDFPKSPNNFWKDRAGKPTETARKAAKQLIFHLAKKLKVRGFTLDGFKEILPHLTYETFCNEVINDWGTTLDGLVHVYNNSPSAVVLDLIEKDSDFKEIRRIGLQPYDFNSPKQYWTDETGQPTAMARAATGQLIRHMAEKLGLDLSTPEGLKEVLAKTGKSKFYHEGINDWGTTLGGMFQTAYNRSVRTAVSDHLSNS